MNYGYFRRLHKSVITKPMSTSTTLSFKTYYPVNNFKRYIKRNPTLFVSLNTRLYGIIGITIPCQISAPRMLMIF